jgi:hypothetical protein
MKLGIEGMYLNTIKAIYDKPIANIILNREKLKPFPLMSETRQCSPVIPSHSNKTGRINKRNSNRKEVKLSLIADDKILYLEDPENHQKNS